MRRICMIGAVLLFSVGCSLNKEFVDRMDAPASMLLPDLRKAYNGEDLGLTQEQRQRRLILLTEWEKTIKEAKNAQK